MARPFATARLLAWALALLVLARPGAAADDPVDSAIDHDPELPMPRVVVEKVFPQGAAELWVRALDRPDADTRCAAAQTIAAAHRRGMPGLAVAVPALLRELDRADQHPTVRTAVAQALVALDARQAAPALLRAAQDDAELGEAAEPALARWDYAPARAVWLDRLGKPASRRRLIVAIQALGTVREEKAVPGLRELVMAATAAPPVRLEAARALGEIRRAGGEPDAERLAADSSPQGMVARLAAASLLRHHQGDAAVRLLQALGRDADAAVAAVAVRRLREIDPRLVVPILDPVLASPDAEVRAVGVEVLFALPNEPHVRLLGARLADRHPDVRSRARRCLEELAGKPGLREPVIRAGETALAAADWRGQEQAAVLLARLGHRPAAARLLELLGSDRPEVPVAAAWGLRKLAVPETVPAVFEVVRARHRDLLASGPTAGRRGFPPGAIDRQLSQLVQFLGEARHRPADDLLRQMVPRVLAGRTPPDSPVGPEARAAAAWALGLFHEGDPDPALAKLFVGRLSEVPPPTAESDRVRLAAAISLGRMRAKEGVPTLRRFYQGGGPTTNPVSNACGWALEQITGERMPPPGVVTVRRTEGGWFLTELPPP